jgi:hypothetical protein
MEAGTFVDTNGEGISGQYIVDGRMIHLIMLVTGFGDNVDLIGPLKGKTAAGNYDDFDNGYPGGGNTDVSSGTFKLAPGCTDAVQRRHPSGHSVTR